eukprot:5897394-Amphidinium_carterae.2
MHAVEQAVEPKRQLLREAEAELADCQDRLATMCCKLCGRRSWPRHKNPCARCKTRLLLLKQTLMQRWPSKRSCRMLCWEVSGPCDQSGTGKQTLCERLDNSRPWIPQHARVVGAVSLDKK